MLHIFIIFAHTLYYIYIMYLRRIISYLSLCLYTNSIALIAINIIFINRMQLVYKLTENFSYCDLLNYYTIINYNIVYKSHYPVVASVYAVIIIFICRRASKFIIVCKLNYVLGK